MRSDFPLWRAFGGWSGRVARAKERFDELCRRADVEGVQWRDLVQDGYRTSGDRILSGVVVRIDWEWRSQEVERRLELKARGE